MSLLDDIKTAQLTARKDRNEDNKASNKIKIALLTTLITEATTGFSAKLRTEAVNAVNKRLGQKQITQEHAEREIATLDATYNKDWLPSDEQVEYVVGQFAKGVRENLKEYEARASNIPTLSACVNTAQAEAHGMAMGLVSRAKFELEILESFLPKQLSEDDLKTIILDFKDKNAGANIGQIMGHLSQNYKGQYDGKLASQLAKS